MQSQNQAAVGPFSSTRFSVAALPARTRYEVWRDSIACIFEVDRARPREAQPDFHATVDMHRIGELLLARTDTVAQRWQRSARTIARDGMDHVMIQYYGRGTQRAGCRTGTVDMPAGGLLVYDLARPMNALTSDFSNLSLILPRNALGDRLDRPDDHHMHALDARQPLVAALRDHMLALYRHSRSMRLPLAAALAPRTAGLVAACLNSGRAGGGVARRFTAPAVAALRRDIESRLDDTGLGRDALASRHGVPGETLDAQFASCGGLAAYVRERRLRRALRMLLDAPRTPVNEVARRVGYRESAFRRAFSRRFEVAPEDLSSLARQPAPDVRAADADRRYEHWLNGL